MKAALTICALALVIAVPPFAGAAIFELANRYPTGALPTCVATADFDGDSDLDLAVGHNGIDSIYVFLGDGAGNFVFDHAFQALHLATLNQADLNNDGVVDLLTGVGSRISLYYGRGDGTFEDRIILDGYYEDPDTSYYIFRDIASLRTADFDADGHTDLVFGDSYRYGAIHIMWGTDNDTLWEGPFALVTGEYLSSVVAADFDGDDDPDLYASVVGLLLNNGDRTFTDWPPPVLSPTGRHDLQPSAAAPAHAWVSLGAGDLNADGRPDLVRFSGGADCFAVVQAWLNNGDSTFAAGVQLFQVPNGVAHTHFEVADLDLNGFNDIIMSVSATANLLLGVNEGVTPWSVEHVPLNYDSSSCVATGDFDGDEDFDMAVVNDDGHVTIGRNIGSRHYLTWIVPDDFPTVQEAVDAAIDGDTILVRQGTWIGPIDFHGKDVTVIAMPALAHVRGTAVAADPSDLSFAEETIIRVVDSGTVVTFANGETSMAGLVGFTIEGGDGALGGGIYCYYTSPVISHNIVRNNQAIHGGGIFTYQSSANIHHNIFYGNTAATWGGGVYLQIQNADLSNNTITQNSAGDEGDGVLSRFGAFTMRNSIVWGNGGTGPEIVTDQGTPVFEYCVIEGGWPGTGNLDEDPMFVDPGTQDFRIQPASPCVDAGDPSSPQDPDGTTADMGAVCYLQSVGIGDDGAVLPASIALDQNHPNPFNPSTAIRFALTQPAHVTLEIYNVLGQRVRMLVDSELPSGRHEQIWDGRNDQGESIASGVYLYRIRTDRHDETRKMLLLR